MSNRDHQDDYGSPEPSPRPQDHDPDFESEERRKRAQYPDEGGNDLDFLYDGNSGVDYFRTEYHDAKKFSAFIKKNYSYISEAEENMKEKFKQLMDVEENNVFFELEMKNNIDEIYKYIHYDEFDAREKSQVVQKILLNCTDILGSNDTNLDVDKKTVDQVSFEFWGLN